MSVYDQPTKILMAEWAKQNLKPGQVFHKDVVRKWFAEHYPKIKRATVDIHVDGMSVNNRNRKHHPNVKPGSKHDLFFKLGPDDFRLWDPETDPAPLYKESIEKLEAEGVTADDLQQMAKQEDEGSPAEQAFAFERDLKNYLVRNLGAVEKGLRVYEEEGISGVEFPVGGRFIDILAVDKSGHFVVFELKVSRGYDRVVGQLLRYMSWIEQNMAGSKHVRGVIVANQITEDLKLAAARVPDIKLVEYQISFALRPV